MPPSGLVSLSPEDSFEPLGLKRAAGPQRTIMARLPWLRIALGSAIIVSCLAYLAPPPPEEAQRAEAPAQHPPHTASLPAWEPILDPNPLLAVDVADFGILPQMLEARRHATGAREDVMRFGAFEEPGAYLNLTAFRAVETAPERVSFFVELARWAASEGLAVSRSGQTSGVATKLGAAEAAEVVLAGTFERVCLAFRFRHAEGGLRLSGWLCGPPDQPVNQMQLTCFIDRLSVAPGAGDPALQGLFAEAESQRNPACGPAVAPAPPVTEARKGSASRRRAKAPAGGSASRGSRG